MHTCCVCVQNYLDCLYRFRTKKKDVKKKKRRRREKEQTVELLRVVDKEWNSELEASGLLIL